MDGKKLNLFDLISLGVGTIIGAGVFSMMGYGIAYTGRGITLALFVAMFLVIMQSVKLPILASVFELDGGSYAITALTTPTMCAGFQAGQDVFFKIGSGAVTVLSIVQYLTVLFPGLDNYKTLAGVGVLTVGYIVGLTGDKFAARIQNVMVALMYAALGIFVIYGLMNYNPAAYAGEPMLPNGITGLMMASALMSYTCNGFQYVINVGKGAENPRKNIPLGFFLSALVAAAIYALIGFAATHAYSYGETAGANLGDLAKLMMPGSLYTFFVVGGALFALATSLIGGITASYRPLMASAQDGWLPAILGKSTKSGKPYVLFFLYAVNLIPLLLGLSLSDMATMSLVPMGITSIITNLYALSVPERFAKQWKESGVKISVGAYRILILLSCVASGILAAYCFLSNNLKVPTTIITVCTFAYGYFRSKSDKVKILSKEEYAEEI